MPRKNSAPVWGNSMTVHVMKGVSVVYNQTSVLDKMWVSYQFYCDPSVELGEYARKAGGTPAELKLCSLWFTECPLFIHDGIFTASVPALWALLVVLKAEGRRINDITVLQDFEQICRHPLAVPDYISLVSEWGNRLHKQVAEVVHSSGKPVYTVDNLKIPSKVS